VRRTKAFTLIELLVVVSIIALLVSILVPALAKAREQAQAVVCMNNLKQIGIGVFLYADDNEEKIPRDVDSLSWILVFMPYVGKESDELVDYTAVEIYECPSFSREGQGSNGLSNGLQTVDYVINGFTAVDGVAEVGPTKVDVFKRPEESIYLADNEAGDWRPVIVDQTTLVAWAAVLDCWSSRHLPSSLLEHDSSLGRRAARYRHRTSGCNNLFMDGHAEWLDADENTIYYWNGSLQK
jgi:prepilin-type N-terminal cleavage/methylation domain-containing protein/prepilin-type processing-associated H-X9-DG protein